MPVNQFNQLVSHKYSPLNLAKDFVDLECFSIVNSNKDLEILEDPRLKKWMQHRNFVILGTGGSSLGGQCIHAISGSEKVKFLCNLDPFTLRNTFSEVNPGETGFLCISKSGETLETVCQTLLALNFTEELGEERGNAFVIITEDKSSSMREIAAKFNCLCLDHPRAIGGRFSVFSLVGMLPALLCGVNPGEIRAGGKKILETGLAEVEKGASFAVENFQRGITQNVSFIYSDKLVPFGAWLAQLYAESTGKSGIGITPITAIGSIDQHSQLQLYIDGNEDKCFTFFYENQNSDLQMGNYLPESFSYLKGKTMAEIFRAQCDATFGSLSHKSVRKIETPELTPEILGALFMHFMLEVVCVCRLMRVNPFDQPAVEQVKISTKKNLLSNVSC
jgi:glucose-6-phosphate isomerase